ncbi:MAG: hypothetical protein KJ062_11020 [Thermoanaerobaculia bacterium]|nr:hypothetical protein [Thermoanaerobaculia bacterium]
MPGPSATSRPAIWAAAAVALLLLATVDERGFALVNDGHQMLSTAFALVHDGEVGISRNTWQGVPRGSFECVSRYGMGQSLLEALPVLASRALWDRHPGTPTAPLFALVPIACLSAAAWGAARAALALGAGPLASFLLGLALPLATPLLGYAASGLSEPLQGAAVSVLLAAAIVLRAEERPGAGWEVAAGLAAGAAILAKSFLVVVVGPLALVAALRGGGAAASGRVRWRVVVWGGLAGSAWALFEVVRFGRLFGGYEGFGFSHPLVDGLLRLTVFPNKGLLWYAPLALLGPVGLAVLWKRDRLLAAALLLASAAVLVLVARWFAWDGQAGWGPRLLVPLLPILVALAAAASLLPRLRLGALALGALGAVVNVLALLVPFPSVQALAAAAATTERAASRLASTASWSPIRLHARLLVEKARGGDVAGRLRAGALSDLTPPLVPAGDLPPFCTEPLVWTYWGRSWLAPSDAVDPYRLALIDQTVRALDLGRFEAALERGRVLVRTGGPVPDPGEVAAAADAALRLGRTAEADRLLSLVAGSCHPALAFVRTGRGLHDPCVPELARPRFLASVAEARKRGLPVTGWSRLVADR